MTPIRLDRLIPSIIAPLILFSCLPPVGTAEDGLDPSYVYYRGLLLVKDAEELEANHDELAALNKLNEAKNYFRHLALDFPDFETQLVDNRYNLIVEKQESLRRAMKEGAISVRRTIELKWIIVVLGLLVVLGISFLYIRRIRRLANKAAMASLIPL